MIARSKLEVSARAVPASEGVRSLVSYLLEGTRIIWQLQKAVTILLTD